MAEEPSLSPRELRWLAMALQGLNIEELAGDLGLDDETVRSEVKGLEQTFAVEGRDDLMKVLRERLDIEPRDEGQEPAEASIEAERRVRLLLRLTLSELLQVAKDAEMRAGLLEDIVARMGSEDEPEAAQEADDLRKVADRMRATVEIILDEIRRR